MHSASRVRMQRGVGQWLIVIAGVVAVAAIVWIALDRDRTVRDSASRAGEPGAVALPRDPAPRLRPPALPMPADALPPTSEEAAIPGVDENQMQRSWTGVDLEAVREAMPDNLYWRQGVPTDDPQVLEQRDAERARWNVEYGKVLSGTGTEEEIRAYYDYRARLSADYLEFATYLLDHYGETLPEQDIGLLHLARRLHQARLEEIPRKVEEALQRKREQDEARAAWLAGEAEFGAADEEAEASP